MKVRVLPANVLAVIAIIGMRPYVRATVCRIKTKTKLAVIHLLMRSRNAELIGCLFWVYMPPTQRFATISPGTLSMRPLCIPIEVQPLRQLDLRDQQEDRRGDLVAAGLRARCHRLAAC
jgi:hypothetical protein